MKYLLDTHVLIWVLENNDRLSAHARKIINTDANEIYVSAISFYEIAIKLSINKIVLPRTLKEVIDQTINDGYIILPLNMSYITQYPLLPLYDNHRDPFDRMIVATAVADNMNIITADEKFTLYNNIVPIIW